MKLIPNRVGWFSHVDFLEFAKALYKASQLHTAWLGQMDMKYVEIRIDMRTGDFIVKNAQGHVADLQKIHNLVELQNDEQEETK